MALEGRNFYQRLRLPCQPSGAASGGDHARHHLYRWVGCGDFGHLVLLRPALGGIDG